MAEQWKLIENHPFYEVSDLGRVRNIRNGKVLKGRPAGRPGEQYPRVLLNGKDQSIHRIVAYYFIGPCPIGKQVNHIDSDKMNPAAINLEYVTPGENVKHGYDYGFHKPLKGESNPAAKLTEQQVAYIRALYVPRKYGQNRLAREFGVTQATIWHIVTGNTWKEVR